MRNFTDELLASSRQKGLARDEGEGGVNLKAGDVVFREDMAELDRPAFAVVTGFPPSSRWVRVRTEDGRYRVWQADRCLVIRDRDLEVEVRDSINRGRLAIPPKGA